MKVRRLALVAVAILAVAAVVLSIPVRQWRTGEPETPPLVLSPGTERIAGRIWIDTDVACGVGPKVDPDDCLAVSLLARAFGARIAGLSTVAGNAPLERVESVARELLAVLAKEGITVPRGSLSDALLTERLTIIALGPLTNVAKAVDGKPELAGNVARVIAVMGKRKGHLFHPSEGWGRGKFFGHGPVFRDFNYVLDPQAARSLLESRIPMTFVPYEAARDVMITAVDLSRIAGSGESGKWMASRARAWLEYWRVDVGIDGFYPFDVLAAAHAIEPGGLECARVKAWIRQPWPLGGYFGLPDALEVGIESEVPEGLGPAVDATYCPRARLGMNAWLMARLAQ